MNEDVVVITTADKIGKTLGFLSMELRDKKGDLIARGNDTLVLHGPAS